ncbi:MAG: hypothetical protein QXL98_03315 [Thermofilaceae archaeon]
MEEVLNHLVERARKERGKVFTVSASRLAKEALHVEKPNPNILREISQLLNALVEANVATIWNERPGGRRKYVIHKDRLLSLK